SSISTLLTEVECPIPSSHAAAFVAAGYYIILQSEGIDKAKAWIADLGDAIQSNYARIDDKVATSSGHPGAKYSANLPPAEQGLPDLESELRRTGLIA